MKIKVLFPFVLGIVLLSCSTQEKYKDTTLPPRQRAADLTSRLTMQEKLSLLGGAAAERLNGIPRLGIRDVRVINGPVGVGGSKSTAFPAAVAMAATWDEDLVKKVGKAIANEMQAKKLNILLGPCVNIHRNPLGGRNFESYSEDPYLTGRMGVHFVEGVQSLHAGTSVKHYALNNQETARGSYSAEPDERTLREIYLPAFEMIVKEAHPTTVMAAYNRFRGVYCTQNKYLLTDILKGEWGFGGFVLSDWDATHSTVPACKAGLDLEMPGPPKFFTEEKLRKALKEGKITEAEINEKVNRILTVYAELGVLDDAEHVPTVVLDTLRHRELAGKVAREAIVLLKNKNGILPLDKTAIHTIAVIGPNAATARVGGGGSSMVTPFYAVSPLEGIKKKTGQKVRVLYNEGAKTTPEDFPVIPSAYLVPPDAKPGEHGLQVEFFNNTDLSGKPVVKRVDKNIDFDWKNGSPDKRINTERFSGRWRGKLMAPKTGRIRIGVNSNDGSYLYVNGLLVVNNWGMHTPLLKSAPLDVKKGKTYDIMVEYYEGGGNASVKLEWQLEKEKEVYDPKAVEMARDADVAVIFAGLSSQWESEGFDRESMDMPGAQDALIKAVAAVNKNTIVVINSGTPVTMTRWIDKVPGILQAWYLGEETGNALADVLFGDSNPGGKLPVTFPVRYEDNPAYGSYLRDKNKATYDEGLYVGYRYYDTKKVKPLFPFGYGLSYTSYQYDNLKINPGENGTAEVSLTVKNTGKRAGGETVQLYVHDVKASVDRPYKELKGFTKVFLNPGEKKTVTLILDKRAFSFYDVKKKQWVAEPGDFELLIGASSRDIRLKGTYTLRE